MELYKLVALLEMVGRDPAIVLGPEVSVRLVVDGQAEARRVADSLSALLNARTTHVPWVGCYYLMAGDANITLDYDTAAIECAREIEQVTA